MTELRGARQLATLNRIARIAVQDLSVQPMLQRIVDTLAEEFDWEFVACASIDRARNEFVCEALCSRVAGSIEVGYRRALGTGVVGECASSGRTIDIDDARDYPGMIDTLGGTLSELCVPVVHNGEVLAVLNAESRALGTFRGQRLMLETVAWQVAGVLHAARLLEELQRSNQQLQEAYRALESTSRLDGLTGIANRRRFDHWLIETSEASVRSDQPMALLLVDVDHFKAYNDNYGHPAGDGCLKRLVRSLEQALGDGSPVRLARYGGEEFVLLAPATNLEAALRLGEKLRRGVHDTNIEHHHGPSGRVTISVGVASGTPDGEAQTTQLLAAADAALYRAKQEGRDCVRAEAG